MSQKRELNTLLLEEVSGVAALLRTGLSLIEKTNFGVFGNYYPMFVCLSNGLERILKLILHFSNKTVPKNHNIVNMYKEVMNLFDNNLNAKNETEMTKDFESFKKDKIFQMIITCLSCFANDERYSRFDKIVKNSSAQMTPEMRLQKIFDAIEKKYLINAALSPSEKQCAQENDSCSFTMLNNPRTSDIIININDLIVENKKNNGYKKYLKMYVGQLIRGLTMYLSNINDEIDYRDIFSYSYLWINDNIFKKKKNWL